MQNISNDGRLRQLNQEFHYGITNWGAFFKGLLLTFKPDTY